jgi:uncharacterized protein YjbI with pentapeptide repeats
VVTVAVYDQCSYTHDISDTERDVEIFEHMDGEEWSCQHPTTDESEYCLFHHPVDEKDDEGVVERFQEIVNTGYDEVNLPPQEQLRFIGAEFGDFSVPLFTTLAAAGQFNPAAAEYPLDLRDVHVAGTIHWGRTTVRHELLLGGSVVDGDVDLSEAVIEGSVEFTGASVSDDVLCNDAQIDGDAAFSKSNITGNVEFAEAEIEGGATFSKAEIGRGGDFTGANIGRRATFSDATVQQSLEFTDATITRDAQFPRATLGDARFDDVEIGGRGMFTDIEIGGAAGFEEAAITDDCLFGGAEVEWSLYVTVATIGGLAIFSGTDIGRAAMFDSAEISANCVFTDAGIEGDCVLSDATIGGKAQFDDATIQTVSLQNATFSGDTTIAGDFNRPFTLTGLSVNGILTLEPTEPLDGKTVLDLTDTTIRSLTVTEQANLLVLNLTGATIRRFDETELPTSDVLSNWSLSKMDFADFDFRNSRELLARTDWDLHDCDPNVADALAWNAVDDRAAGHADDLTALLAGIPALSERVLEDETIAGNAHALVREAAHLVFTDEDRTSTIVDDGAINSVSVADDPAVSQSPTDRGVYTLHTATAILAVRDAIETDPAFSSALSADAVADQLTTIAARVVDAAPETGPRVRTPPEEQVDIATLPTDALATALAERYAEPADFRASNNPQTWETTYMSAKVAASEQGLNEVAAEFFIREKRFKRRLHAQRVRKGGSFERPKAAFEWVANLTMDWLTGYGERPRNVIMFSLLAIGAFAGIYWGLGALPPGSEFVEYLLFSLQNFVTFIIGTRPQGTLIVRFTSAIEAFLGAFLVALFVFSLTRSLNR